MGTIIAVTAAAGMGGTGLGGLSAYLFRRGTDRTVSVLLSFAAGMMLAVVCADLLADAIQAGPGLSALPAASASVLAGCGGIWLLEELVSGLQAGAKRGGLFLAGVVMAAAIALHNLPEGMVIGASYAADLAEAGQDGRMMALVIGLHNIPEGMAIAVPLAAGGAARGRAVLTTAAAGAPTVLGAVLGFCLGTMGPGLQMLTLGGGLRSNAVRGVWRAAAGVVPPVPLFSARDGGCPGRADGHGRGSGIERTRPAKRRDGFCFSDTKGTSRLSRG